VTVTQVQRFIDKRWFWVVIGYFAIVYLFSLSFAYVEGDDASSIVYHLYGRNSTIQPPYSPYHSMLDTVLGLLPINETLLRTAAVGLTSLAAIGIVLFMLAIGFDWLKTLPLAPSWLIALVVLLASPEFFYLGLVYLPGVIAMALVLAAHLILRWGGSVDEPPSLATNRGRLTILLSAVVFGIGVACRWDITVYGAVIAADLIFGYGDRRQALIGMIRRRWLVCVVWGVLALLCFFLALVISGYGPDTVVAQLQKYQNYLGERSSRITETIGSLQPLATPAFAIFALVGLITLLRRRDPLLIVVAVGLIVILPWASRGVPKFILPGIPGLVACAIVGFSVLWTHFKPERWQTIVRVLIFVLLLGPWLIGVQVEYDDSAFGPGFETRAFDRPEPTSTKISLAIFGSGTLFPTSEGPRALFGHAAVLLGGGWRRAIDERWQEIETVTDYAIQNDLPLISTGNMSNFVVSLWQRGFTTSDPRDPNGESEEASNTLILRTFTNEAGQTLDTYKREITGTQIELLHVLPTDLNQIVLHGYPRTLRKLYLDAPVTLLEKLGSVSALLDLEALRPIIAQTAKS
jgi:hypothetical protein